jgi:uncharacterized membrane protein
MSIDETEKYLRRLKWSLRRLPAEDRAAIDQEIRSHLLEKGAVSAAALQETLRELGEPHELAAGYLQEFDMLDALSRPAPARLLFALLGRIARNLRIAPSAIAGCAFYILSASFLAIAMLKPFAAEGLPGFIGKFGLGGLARTPAATDLLGWVLLPLGLALALICYLSGTAILRRAARSLLSAR